MSTRGLFRADKEMVTAVCWTPSGELLACSDDKTISKWWVRGREDDHDDDDDNDDDDDDDDGRSDPGT
jgi:hypothetical protein